MNRYLDEMLRLWMLMFFVIENGSERTGSERRAFRVL